MNKAVLEGLLFVVGEDGLTIDQIVDVLEIDEENAKTLIMELKKDYEDDSRGLRIDFLGNRFKITTKFEHKAYYQKLIENPETNFLSQAALETLAIIAYNEPITRIQAYRIITEACLKAGITCKIGTHTLRKTFGYHFYQEKKDIALLQTIFNHSTPSVTMRYIGINQDIIDSSLQSFCL